jgi:hypothetical protein
MSSTSFTILHEEKTLTYPGFEPGTFGFQVGNATNWTIEVDEQGVPHTTETGSTVLGCWKFGLKIWNLSTSILGKKLNNHSKSLTRNYKIKFGGPIDRRSWNKTDPKFVFFRQTGHSTKKCSVSFDFWSTKFQNAAQSMYFHDTDEKFRICCQTFCLEIGSFLTLAHSVQVDTVCVYSHFSLFSRSMWNHLIGF